MRSLVDRPAQLLGGRVHPDFFDTSRKVNKCAGIRRRTNSRTCQCRRTGASTETDLPFRTAANLIVEGVAIRRRYGGKCAIASNSPGQRNRACASRCCRFENAVADDECHLQSLSYWK